MAKEVKVMANVSDGKRVNCTCCGCGGPSSS